MTPQDAAREVALRTAGLAKILGALRQRPVKLDEALVSSLHRHADRTALLAAVAFEHGEAEAA